MEYAILIAAGLVGGFLAGLLGIGGGVIFVFVLSVFFEKMNIDSNELPRYLIANSIFATFFAGLSSSLKNRKFKSFHLKDVLYCAIPGALTALVITYTITNFNWYNKQRFTLFFVVLLFFFFVRLLRKEKNVAKQEPNEFSKKGTAMVGAFSGIISSLSGLGGGVVMIPLLTQTLKMPMARASSISLGVIPFFALSMSLFYAFAHQPQVQLDHSFGYLVFPAAIPLALGVIVAAPFGVKIARNLSGRVIKVMFATLIAIVVLKMIYGYFN